MNESNTQCSYVNYSNNQYNNLDAIELIMELSCFYSNVWSSEEKTVNTSTLKKTIDGQIDFITSNAEV